MGGERKRSGRGEGEEWEERGRGKSELAVLCRRRKKGREEGESRWVKQSEGSEGTGWGGRGALMGENV